MILAVLIMSWVGSILGAAPAAVADDDTLVIEEELTIAGTPEPDGAKVRLDVTILTTATTRPRPAIVLAHGFGGSKSDSLSAGRTLARKGYVVIAYTARGFGRSGGKIHLDNPAFEGKDATKIIDLVAAQDEVQKDGDDPVVGFAGGSYGGAISLIAAGLDDRIDAIAPAFTWHSLTQALFPQYASTGTATTPASLTPIAETGVFKKRWAALFFLGGGGGAQGPDQASAGLCGRFTAELCRGYTQTASSGRPDPELIKLLDESSTEPLLAEIKAPTLIIQGEQDTLFPLDHADANLRGLPADTPAAMQWVTGGHDSEIAIDDLLPELTGWFDQYLKDSGAAPESGDPRPEPVEGQFSYVVPETSLVGSDRERDPEEFTLPAYPGRGSALEIDTVQLAGGPQTMINPPGGSPSALTSLPGAGAALAGLQSAGGYPLAVLPGQSVRFTSAPLEQPRTLLGSGTAEISITSSASTASLFASVWDLGPDNSEGQPSTATLPQSVVAPIQLSGLTPGRPSTVQITVPPVVHRVPVGHRLQLVISSTDQAYAGVDQAASFTIGLENGGALTLPQVDGTALDTASLDVPRPLVIVVAALVLAGLIAMLALWLRRRRTHPRTDLQGTPLVVEDLVKTYGDGFKAVDGVSFRAEGGQVVGLLGPNGAGKTTTMRMMVGLIRPDSGSVYVDGEPVHAGADVLGSVGALIEGPGFLPHLTGIQNLQAFWSATGRPADEAHLDEALEIAGLGKAIHRRVRGYSQGMRQRLGIAQAMLGLPELLLLDEPTNGLDPPQIKAMRSVLHDYADRGRTVVVSSHLLAEVEQTCSHVVVMHRGKIILSGAIKDLTETGDVTVIEFADGVHPAEGGSVLADTGVVTEVISGALRVEGDLPRSEVVRLLVEAGLKIDSVDGHRQLEEVFMNLVRPTGTDAELDHEVEVADA